MDWSGPKTAGTYAIFEHMGTDRKRSWAWAFFILPAIYLIAVYILPSLVDTSDGQEAREGHSIAREQSEECVKRKRVPIQDGERDGQPWKIFASIENNHDCGAWLLSMEFLPQGGMPGSWKGFWEIPAGGHLPDSATISAQDEATGEERVISGVVGWRVKTVVFRTKSGRRFVVHPKAPDTKLRRQFGWLQNLKYFLRFYPIGDPVKAARLLDSRGSTIATFRCRLGELQGNMSY